LQSGSKYHCTGSSIC